MAIMSPLLVTLGSAAALALSSVSLTSPAAAQPAQAAPPAASARTDDRIRLTPDGEAEEWWLAVQTLPARTPREQPSHAVIFVASLKACGTPDTFAIVFVSDTGRVSKQGARLSRQKDPAGGCVDALATVFPKGTAGDLIGATRLSVTLPGRTFELSAAQIDYVRRALQVEPGAAPAESVSTATMSAPARELPADPAARAAAEESYALNERAVGFVGQGRLKEARKASESAVAAAEKAYGPSHVEVARVLVNLGVITRRLGDDEAAAGHYRRATEILEQAGELETLGLALDNLGIVLRTRKDLDGAIAAATRAVDVLTKALGPDDLHVGYALNNLAIHWSEKGDQARAVALCDRAVAVLTAALGQGNPELQPFLEDQRTLRKRASR
jgi:tetratricopeptide (TPR) repeat protein